MRKTRVRKLKQKLMAAGMVAPSRSAMRQIKRAWVAHQSRKPFDRNADAVPPVRRRRRYL